MAPNRSQTPSFPDLGFCWAGNSELNAQSQVVLNLLEQSVESQAELQPQYSSVAVPAGCVLCGPREVTKQRPTSFYTTSRKRCISSGSAPALGKTSCHRLGSPLQPMGVLVLHDVEGELLLLLQELQALSLAFSSPDQRLRLLCCPADFSGCKTARHRRLGGPLTLNGTYGKIQSGRIGTSGRPSPPQASECLVVWRGFHQSHDRATLLVPSVCPPPSKADRWLGDEAQLHKGSAVSQNVGSKATQRSMRPSWATQRLDWANCC